MGHIINEDISKLPKWAQSKIQDLEKQISSLRKSRDPHEGSMIEWGYGHMDFQMAHGNIPTGERVKFIIDKKQDRYVCVRVDDDNTVLISSSHEIALYPHATNTIHVRLRDR